MNDEQEPNAGRRPLRVIRRRTAGTAARAEGSGRARDQRVAVVIPAKDEQDRIADTVYAVRAIPHVDLVLVVDDGSEDDTQHAARSAGAVVVRHSQNRGKASAMETGASVVAMRDVEDGPARLLLFVDADLGATAVNVAPLVPPVVAGRADMSIAVLPPQPGAGGRGIVTGLARKSIQRATGWAPTQPLSGQRCMTREVFDAATPLARGWGVETGMTIDVLMQGFAVVEVPCDLRHRPSGNNLRGQLHRAAQYRDVTMAVAARRFRHYKQKVVREPDSAGEGGPESPAQQPVEEPQRPEPAADPVAESGVVDDPAVETAQESQDPTADAPEANDSTPAEASSTPAQDEPADAVGTGESAVEIDETHDDGADDADGTDDTDAPDETEARDGTDDLDATDESAGQDGARASDQSAPEDATVADGPEVADPDAPRHRAEAAEESAETAPESVEEPEKAAD